MPEQQMTKLEKKRDELAAQEDMKAFVNPQITFKRGFDSALAELMPQVQKLVDALGFYAKDSEFLRWLEKNDNPMFQCLYKDMKNNHDVITAKAKQALTEWREYVEEK
jgi:hypothetical protein